MAVEDVPLTSLMSLLELCIDCAERPIATLRCDFDQMRDIYIVGMLRALIAYARSVLALVHAREFAGIPVITRSALDAHVDIANLCAHSDYWKQLDALDTAEWTRILERASEGSNPYLRALAQDPSFVEGRKLFAERRRILEKHRIERPTPEKRFELAGLKVEYQAVWSILSAEVHNNVSHLRTKYFVVDGDMIRAKDRASGDGQNWEHSCSLHMSELVLESTERVLRYCQHGIGVLSDARRDFDRIYAAVFRPAAAQR
jgi:hypothetical protein